MKPLQVCHLGKYYPPAPGGIETHTRTLARAQAELGMGVRVYCVNHREGPTVVEADGPVALTRFGRAGSAMKLDFCPGLLSKLRRVDADILHLHVPNPTMILALLCARPRQPVVVTYHSDVIHQKPRGCSTAAYRRVRAILPTSPVYFEGSPFLKEYATDPRLAARDRPEALSRTLADAAPSRVAAYARNTRKAVRSGSAPAGSSITRDS